MISFLGYAYFCCNFNVKQTIIRWDYESFAVLWLNHLLFLMNFKANSMRSSDEMRISGMMKRFDHFKSNIPFKPNWIERLYRRMVRSKRPDSNFRFNFSLLDLIRKVCVLFAPVLLFFFVFVSRNNYLARRNSIRNDISSKNVLCCKTHRVENSEREKKTIYTPRTIQQPSISVIMAYNKHAYLFVK